MWRLLAAILLGREQRKDFVGLVVIGKQVAALIFKFLLDLIGKQVADSEPEFWVDEDVSGCGYVG